MVEMGTSRPVTAPVAVVSTMMICFMERRGKIGCEIPVPDFADAYLNHKNLSSFDKGICEFFVADRTPNIIMTP
jgi:hypothetical protein